MHRLEHSLSEYLAIPQRLKVILIEINNRVGYDPCGNPPDYNPITGPWTQAYTQFSQDYFQWVYEEAIRPVMAAKGKLKNRR